jgi:hypothetical protein
MDTTTRLIRWQRITIVVLLLALLSAAITAAYQARTSEARRQDALRLRQRVNEYDAKMRWSGLTPADVAYLQWFQEFDTSCRTMSKRQANALSTALHSSEEHDLERIMASSKKEWFKARFRFHQQSPPPSCAALTIAYGDRLGLMAEEVDRCVSMMMMISSQLYSNETPQGRKWSRVHLGARQWYQEAAARQRSFPKHTSTSATPAGSCFRRGRAKYRIPSAPGGTAG